MNSNRFSNRKFTRRDFIKTVGASSAGLMANRFLVPGIVGAHSATTVKVATATVSTYDETLIKQALEWTIESVGGLGDIIKSGDKVGIKINLTGGAERAQSYQQSSGLPPGDSYWTNPVLLKAVGEAVMDAGAGELYIIEALADWESVNDFGYKEVIDSLGATFIDLNYEAPYTQYVEKSVGDNHLIYPELTLNSICSELDCLISIPKAKQHATAGVTHGMKNLVGLLPIPSGKYNADASYRKGIHQLEMHDGIPNNNLCRVILDINRANPIHLVVNDAVKTVLGSEGPWTGDGITPATFDKLIVGKDPVAVDSVSTHIMGFDPMADDDVSPYTRSLNYLKLASEHGLGEYDLSRIEVIDDVTGVENRLGANVPNSIQLHQNYPNPFNPSTVIQFDVHEAQHVSLKIFNTQGREIAALFEGTVAVGSHKLNWNATGLSSGAYMAQLRAGNVVQTRQLVFMK